MTGATPLHELVAVGPRFLRSVALARDFERHDALDGYLLTPTGRGVLARLAEALRHESPARAWSLTGPYGSGKSAFALFVAQLLCGRNEVRKRARGILEGADSELAGRLFGGGSPLARKGARLCPVLVSGTREPLEKALAGRLALALRAAGRGRPPRLVEQLERLAGQPSLPGTGSAVVPLFEEALDYLERFGPAASGILLVVDELGKFLEHGAAYPDRGDVFALQGLAEAAARARRPFLFLTVLHQALDRYAEHLSPGRRAEWAKVQGRFEDVAFEERAEQVVRLVAQAVRRGGPEPARKALEAQGQRLAAEARALGLRLGSLADDELQALLARCYPLHPLAALVVGPLFRQLAQNERTLFAFLSAAEPAGFQEHLRQQAAGRGGCEPYRLDQLYDYVTTAVGPALFAQQRGRYWAEVQVVLERLHNAPALEQRLARVIGLLQALGGAAGVPASQGVLRFALEGAGCSAADIDAALDSLCRRSVVVFRRHAGSYVLWEGSDVDLEARLEEGRRSVDAGRGLASFLARQVPPRPLVARRHYLQKGTLRFFEACYADRDGLADALHRPLGEADGRLVYCLPLSGEDRQAMEAVLRSPRENVAPAVLAALPTEVVDLREWCHELAGLQWVLHHTPELETDSVARRELQTRLLQAEEGLRSYLTGVFRPVAGEAGRCQWFRDGREADIGSVRGLNDYLSEVCDEVYPHTPVCRNELINRRNLSSAAAAARRTLIQAMIEHPREPALAIQGTPPERSMYESVLRATGLHRKQGDAWGFHPPKGDPAMARVWRAIDEFFAESESARQPIGRLFTVLGRPPFGLKEGVLPVLLVAALLHSHAEVALYEEGTFVPRLSAAIVERILRAPAKFEVQRCRLAGARGTVFRRYAALLSRGDEAEAGRPTQLLDIVRPLIRLVRQLPDYVAKTRGLGRAATAVLRAIREARHPDRLLFSELPRACGVSAFEADAPLPPEQADAFFGRLQAALGELQQAYPRLLADIERLLLQALRHPGPLAKARPAMAHEARLLLNLAVDARLQAFLTRVGDEEADDRTWLESLASLLAGKPPPVWDDQDRARFEVQLAATARTFHHFKVLAFEMGKAGAALLDGDLQMLRVSITVPNAAEVERVVQVPPQLQERVREAQERVRQVLASADLLTDRDLSVAVLAQLARQMLAEGEPGPPAEG